MREHPRSKHSYSMLDEKGEKVATDSSLGSALCFLFAEIMSSVKQSLEGVVNEFSIFSPP
ncbi:MAG: hypothetical protein PHH38_05880 [Candidatus Cloacimonetes bacterium]|nr:hypothetical protein [Candidatus Cloacimonadota bacterium]